MRPKAAHGVKGHSRPLRCSGHMYECHRRPEEITLRVQLKCMLSHSKFYSSWYYRKFRANMVMVTIPITFSPVFIIS
jgi:hypothetical protein